MVIAMLYTSSIDIGIGIARGQYYRILGTFLGIVLTLTIFSNRIRVKFGANILPSKYSSTDSVDVEKCLASKAKHLSTCVQCMPVSAHV